MFGGVFIIIGIIILLQAAGVFGTISNGIIWGTAFILIGIFVAVRRSMRGKRRAEWIEKRRSQREGKADLESKSEGKN